MTGWLWTLITILGPLLLIAAIVWAYLRNRNPAPGEKPRSTPTEVGRVFRAPPGAPHLELAPTESGTSRIAKTPKA